MACWCCSRRKNRDKSSKKPEVQSNRQYERLGTTDETVYPSDTFLGRRIRGVITNGQNRRKRENENKIIWNDRGLRYDNESRRWYLKLSPLDVKETRAKVWQLETE